MDEPVLQEAFNCCRFNHFFAYFAKSIIFLIFRMRYEVMCVPELVRLSALS